MSQDSEKNAEILSKIFKIGYSMPFPTNPPEGLGVMHPELTNHFNVNMRAVEAIGADLSGNPLHLQAYMAGAFARLAVVGATAFAFAVGTGQAINYFMGDADQKVPQTSMVKTTASSASAPQLSRK